MEDCRLSEKGEGRVGEERQPRVLRLQRICPQGPCHKDRREAKPED